MGRRAKGLARDLTMVPGRPWTPERCAEVETDCTCSLGALFLQDQTTCPNPNPNANGREEKLLDGLGKC